MQLQLELKPMSLSVHKSENNSESEIHLKENRQHFSNQCQQVLELLKSGIRLTRKDGMTIYNINSVERRIKDLIENGVDVKKEWVRDEEGKKIYVEYFL